MKPILGAGFLRNYNFWEYSLVAYPSDSVSNKIIQERALIPEEELSPESKCKPHVALAHFGAKEIMEDTLVRWIQNICNLQSAFTVELEDFCGYPPHLIYLKIKDPKPFVLLANGLTIIDGFIQSNDCPPLHVVTNPCLGVAQTNSQAAYEEALSLYVKRRFREAFNVERLMLIKRFSENEPVELVNSFRLSPLS